MSDRMRGWVLRLLRVPAEPRVPADSRTIRVFRAARNYFRYRLVRWGLGQLGALVGVVGIVAAIQQALPVLDGGAPVLLLSAFQVVLVGAYLLQLGFSLAVLRFDFDLRWYILSDRSLRIREGILSMREKTMTFANIQQISIRQNPLQRILGIADVQVRTAGGGSGASGGKHGHVGEGAHEAFFRGVDNAEEIRAAIRERVRLHRDAGLGDPDEPPPLAEPNESAAVAAARELRREMRELRAALEARRPTSV